MQRRRTLGKNQPGKHRGRELDICAGLNIHESAILQNLHRGRVRADVQECAGQHTDILHECTLPDVGPVAQIGVLYGPAAESIKISVVQNRIGHRRTGLNLNRSAVLRDLGHRSSFSADAERCSAGNRRVGRLSTLVKIEPSLIFQDRFDRFSAAQDADAAVLDAVFDKRIQQEAAFRHMDNAFVRDRCFRCRAAAGDRHPAIVKNQI